MKRLARIGLLLAWLASLVVVAHAQTVISPTSVQVYNRGIVQAIVVQPDGKVIVGGKFGFVNQLYRRNLIRLNTDGSLDTSWEPDVNGVVNALALDGSGNLYVAGTFTSVGNQARNRLARVSTTTGAVDAWNPDADSDVYALALDGAGSIYAAGLFTSLGGQNRLRIARLSTSTGAADTWNPNVATPLVFSGVVYTLALDSGFIFAGGTFDQIGGQTRNGLAKLSTTTGNADAWDPAPAGDIFSLARNGTDLYVGGNFSNIGGQARASLAKLSTTTSVADATWNPALVGSPSVYRVVLDGANLYAGTSSGVSKVSASGTGAAIAGWAPAAGSTVAFAALATSGTKVYAGGYHLGYAGVQKVGFVAMNSTTGAGDAAWPTFQDRGWVQSILRDGAGNTYVGGSFIWAGDMSTIRRGLARFTVAGLLDTTWIPNPTFVGSPGGISAMALDLSGHLYVAGFFSSIGSGAPQPRNGLARLSTADATADAWDPNPGGGPPAFAVTPFFASNASQPGFNNVNALVLDGSGSVFAGGWFSSIGGQNPMRFVAKLATAGTGLADPTWNPNPGSTINTHVRALALDGTGSLFVGGDFTTIGGQSRNRIAKILATGTGAADASWNPNAINTVSALERDLSGNLYVGGSFASIGGLSRGRIAKVSASGTGAVDPTWNPNAIGEVWSLALDLSGNLYAGGNFVVIGGLGRSNVAKLATTGSGAADAVWGPNPDGPVAAIEFDGSGNVCLGGQYQQVAGQLRSSYACVSPTVALTAPQITSGNAAIFAVQTAGTFTVTATGNPVPTLSVTGTLPTGVQFNPSTGVLGGTPAVGTVGGYPLTVTASNGVNPNATQNFTLTVTATVPGKPTITNVTSQSNQATVAFAAPGNDGGDPILFYTARCTNGATTQTNTGGGTPITVTGLTNNTQYSCTVAATNGKGEGPQSDPASVTPIDLGTLVFGGQSMGTTSPPKAVGFGLNVPVTVTAITVSAQFGQSNDCATVPANQTCTIQVYFSPTPVAGAVNASLPVSGTLTITTSNVGSFTVALSGIAEKSLVTHYYSAILRRAPDAGGKQFWINQANLMASLGVNVNETWFAMAQQFFSSAEYASLNRTNNGFVTDLYITFFNRSPDPGGLDFWVGQLTNGLPREVALAGFMFSAEFAGFTSAIFGNAATRAEVGVVMDFYRGLLSRLPDQDGLNFWVNRFRVAQCAGAGNVYGEVEEISRQFANGGEYLGKNRTNAQYVGDLYNAFLRRGGDLGGVNSWINFLVTPPNLGTGEQPGTARERVRRQFIASGEFQARVNAIVNQGCLP